MRYLPIKGYEGQYEVSDSGEVRSIDRVVTGKDGASYPFKGRVLRPSFNKQLQYPQVGLWDQNKGTTFYIHRLVAEAFVPNPLNLPEVNHIDGNRLNPHFSNLEWVTSKGNSQHAILTGLTVYTNRLTKEEFVECLYSVINGESYSDLSKRVPYKVPFLSVKVKRIAKELNLLNELEQSIYEQRVIRARINGARNKPSH